MLLRSDAEVALDEALLAAAEAGRLHREAAFLSRSPLDPRFAAADLRDRIAEELATAAREAGWLPRSPDPDAEAARALGKEIEAAVFDQDEALLEDHRRRADRNVLDRLKQLLAVEGLPSSVAKTASLAIARLDDSVVASDQS
ncbi:MAG TPA: hypothetical protein VED46_08560 [Alphaproteobacteria bacterium]|nr:hypothetical protein [Alphaproteobacteria bacterium]